MTRTNKQRNVSGISPTREEGPPKVSDQTTYVLVHGAWHGSWCWKRVRKSLWDAGHQVFTPTLTGLGERSHLNSAAVNLSAEHFNVNLRDAAWVNAQCTPQSIASFEEHIRLKQVPSHTHDATHILATGWDNSPFRAAHERAKAKGWKTRTVACGHEVMLDLPGELTDLLLEFATSAVRSTLLA